MIFSKTSLEGLILIEPRVFEDERGYFYETYHQHLFQQNGIKEEFKQSNQSFSAAGVIRGLHMQKEPFAQGKLVRVISGEVLDVAVDLRPGSPTYGKHEKFVLSGENFKILYVPEGFAHGFATIRDAIFTYNCTNVYNKASELGIIYNDEDLDIDWEIQNPIISDKDLVLPTLRSLQLAVS